MAGKKATKKPRPLPGWDTGLTELQRQLCLAYQEVQSYKAAAVMVGLTGNNLSQEASRRMKSIKMANAWAMLNGDMPPRPDKLKMPLPKKAKGVGAALDEEVMKGPSSAAVGMRGYKTAAANRLLNEVKRTPLDVMLGTMNSLWDQAEEHEEVSDRGERVDTEESIGFKKQACGVARDAAPYMHARLSAVEQTVISELDKMSDGEIDGALVKLVDSVADLSSQLENQVSLARVAKDSREGLDLVEDDEEEAGVPPMH